VLAVLRYEKKRKIQCSRSEIFMPLASLMLLLLAFDGGGDDEKKVS